MKKTLFLMPLILLIFGCHNVDLTFKPGMELPDSIKSSFHDAADKYFTICKAPATLYISDTSLLGKDVESASGIYGMTLAFGRSGEVTINRDLLSEYTVKSARDLFMHEVFHTLKRDSVTTTIHEDDAKEIFSSGLSFIVLNKKTGKFERYSGIEEAAAEACANLIYYDYSRSNSYQNLSSLMMELMDKGFISVADLVEATKKSDLRIVVARILNKSASDTTLEDIVGIVRLFKGLPVPTSIAIVKISHAKEIDWIMSHRATSNPSEKE